MTAPELVRAVAEQLEADANNARPYGTRRIAVPTLDGYAAKLRAALALLLTGCAFAPEDATPFDPPPSYRAVWDSAQACTGLRGDFARLHFFSLPGRTFDTPEGPQAGRTEGTTIYLAEVWLRHPMVVKHEMIHALGVHHHPRVPFEDPCHATWASYTGTGELAE